LDDPDPQGPANKIAGLSYLVMIFLLVVQIPLYVRYRVREFHIFTAGTSLGEVRFGSDLQTKQIVWLIVWAAILMVIFVSLLAALFVGLLAQSAGSGQGRMGGGFVGFMIGILVFAVVVLPAINLVIVQFGLTEAVVNSLAMINLPAVEAIIQSTQEISGHGEGLADAFDLGEF
jgi:uncharacterized membrane protein